MTRCSVCSEEAERIFYLRQRGQPFCGDCLTERCNAFQEMLDDVKRWLGNWDLGAKND